MHRRQPRLIASDRRWACVFRWRRFGETNIPRHELQTRRRLFTAHRGSPLHPGAFSALAPRSLTSLELICLTQLALLLSVPLLTVGVTSRNEFAAVLFAARNWGKLAILFAVGITELFLYENFAEVGRN